MASVTAVKAKTTTAEDTLAKKSQDANIAVIGNNSATNQIRYGQLSKYGEERGNVGNLLGHVSFSRFAEMLGGYGEEVRDSAEIQPSLQRAREAVKTSGKSAVINIWVDPGEWSPGTKRQTMYK